MILNYLVETIDENSFEMFLLKLIDFMQIQFTISGFVFSYLDVTVFCLAVSTLFLFIRKLSD